MASIVGLLHQDHINSTNLLDVLEQQLVIFSRAEVPDYEMMQGTGWKFTAWTISIFF